MEVPNDDNNERPRAPSRESEIPDQATIRIRLTPPKVSQEQSQLDNNTSPTDQGRVIYLRLTPHEKTQLDNEIFHWGYRGGGREVAEELSRNPTPIVEETALKLFRRWSFALAVKRALASCLQAGMSATRDENLQQFRQFLDTRSDDPLQQLPGDSRRRRVDALLGDEINAAFFSNFGVSAPGFRSDQYIVVPHPKEVHIWRLLAYQAWRNGREWCSWPGVHEAAAFVARREIGNVALKFDEFPYYELWDPAGRESEPTSDNDMESDSEPEESDLEREESDLEREESDSEREDIDTLTDFNPVFLEERDPEWLTPWPTVSWRTLSIRRRQKEMRKRYAMFEEADVWDVWILCQMVRCQEAVWGFDQNTGTEFWFWKFEQLDVFKQAWVRREGPDGIRGDGGFLQRRLASGEDDENTPVDLRQRWPLPLPRDFIEFANYDEYWFEEIKDEDVISSLLASAGLSTPTTDPSAAHDTVPNIEWDLIYLNLSRHDPLQHEVDREHLHHTIYTSDDYIQWEYDKGAHPPGLCHPCECIQLSPSELAQRHEEEDEEYERILQEGKKFINGEGSSKAPRRNPMETGEIQWRRKYDMAKLRKDMREKHGRWREFPPEHYDYGHAGGNVVFNRRRVEDVPEFVKGLDRFWVDWNDCMLIMGGGVEDDEECNRMDEDTIYILETLPGIKRRWEKMRKA